MPVPQSTGNQWLAGFPLWQRRPWKCVPAEHFDGALIGSYDTISSKYLITAISIYIIYHVYIFKVSNYFINPSQHSYKYIYIHMVISIPLGWSFLLLGFGCAAAMVTKPLGVGNTFQKVHGNIDGLEHQMQFVAVRTHNCLTCTRMSLKKAVDQGCRSLGVFDLILDFG